MKEIKFRAWDFDKKIMSGVEQLVFDKEGVDMQKPLLRAIATFHKGLFSSQQFELMQFTGLLDKDGKEIYEGDILDGLGKVIWIEDEVRFGIDILGETKEIEFWELKQNEIEVIGNIWENGELIK